MGKGMYDFIYWEVRDVMVENPMTVAPDTTIREAQDIFENHDFNGLPVLEQDRLVGLVTKLDLLKAFAFRSESKVPAYAYIMDRPVSEVMTTKPDTVAPDTPLTRTLRLMIETRHKALPVVNGDRLVGIVAREDILWALDQAAEGKRPPRLDLED